jgi:predicted HNH restriction endonuclease
LQFHHRDPSQKDFQISGSTKGYETLKKEVDKCLMVCANCHTEIHSEVLDINKIDLFPLRQTGEPTVC